jgi:hypothetical protein
MLQGDEVPVDVRRYGIVANSAEAATANTAALRALLDPRAPDVAGLVIFPNSAGHDSYEFG